MIYLGFFLGGPKMRSGQMELYFTNLDFPEIYGLLVAQVVWGRYNLTRWDDDTPPKFNSSPLKNDGWKTILSFWEGKFSGANC